MKTQTLDMIGIPIKSGDLVVYYNNIYEVLSVGPYRVRIILAIPAKTTRPCMKAANECMVLSKEQVEMFRSKNS